MLTVILLACVKICSIILASLQLGWCNCGLREKLKSIVSSQLSSQAEKGLLTVDVSSDRNLAVVLGVPSEESGDLIFAGFLLEVAIVPNEYTGDVVTQTRHVKVRISGFTE